ncbi:hypothetical protein F5Y10DRAFT_284364 [Nemania abortiva]|nr:hypothetical protein F5Y10DRAFT_284364 [Nemania abortiva]
MTHIMEFFDCFWPRRCLNSDRAARAQGDHDNARQEFLDGYHSEALPTSGGLVQASDRPALQSIYNRDSNTPTTESESWNWEHRPEGDESRVLQAHPLPITAAVLALASVAVLAAMLILTVIAILPTIAKHYSIAEQSTTIKGPVAKGPVTGDSSATTLPPHESLASLRLLELHPAS